MPTREVIIPKGMEILYEKYHYCPGLKVGNTLYISGQVGRDENLRLFSTQYANPPHAMPKILALQEFWALFRINWGGGGAKLGEIAGYQAYHPFQLIVWHIKY